jgi:hypothetical protein
MPVRRGFVAVTLALAASAPAARADPIPERATANTHPAFVGGAWNPAPVSLVDAPRPPRHPFMAPNDRSNLHDDAYQTDTVDGPGPLGRDMEVLSTAELGDCASVTFDTRGRLETICVGIQRPVLKLFDPRTLEELATMDLPPRQPGGGNLFQDFAGGGYFYLDPDDRAVIPTTTRHILIVRQADGGRRFEVHRDFDVSGLLAADDKIISALPDWSGRLWFASIQGVVGTIDPRNGAVRTYITGEPIGNSHAIDETGGVYIITDGALYRFDAGPDGAPRVTWRETYPNIGVVKPGQTQRGSGVTPSLMGSDYVAVTDNDDPMHVMVFRRARRVSGPRLVCRHPVFERGSSATDNSLIVTATSMVVENNYGYQGPQTTVGGTTTPGVERVDLDPDGSGCHTVWRSREISPTVVPKLSLENGLVYLYTKEADPNMDDPWYLTALDFRTGRTVYKRLSGRGLGYNNNYAPITLGPDGTAYVGALGGLVALRDRTPPPRVRRPSGLPAGVRMVVGIRGLQRRSRGFGRRCARRNVRIVLGGRGTYLVRRVDFLFGTTRRQRPARVDTRLPFDLRVRRRSLRTGRYYRVRAAIVLRDGRRFTLTRAFQAC